jgi:hypothetical protein
MPSLILAEYLDESEARELGEKLRALDVAVAVKWHGLPRFFTSEVNCKVIVDAEDLGRAEPVKQQFFSDLEKKRAAQKQLLMSQCPWCTSKNIALKEKKDLWQKFRFYGVSVWRCNDCGGGWYL